MTIDKRHKVKVNFLLFQSEPSCGASTDSGITWTLCQDPEEAGAISIQGDITLDTRTRTCPPSTNSITGTTLPLSLVRNKTQSHQAEVRY